MKITSKVAFFIFALAFIGPFASAADDEAPVVAYLKKGDLKAGHKALEAQLAKTPGNGEARLSLGIVQLLAGVERISQSFYKHGLQPGGPRLPFVRMDVPVNPKPEPIDYAKLRKILQRMIDDLQEVDQTLAKVNDADVKVRIPVGDIRLDLDGDGEASQPETFWRIFASVVGPRVEPVRPEGKSPDLSEEERAFPIAFDQADVHWLRGYTHVLRAMLEAYLAHDGEKYFQQTGHIYFAGAKAPYPKLKDDDEENMFASRIADLIAALHLIRLEVKEKERMVRAHEHLLAMVDQSRQCWKHAQNETDNDREWIPNAKQVSVIGLPVTEEQIEAWDELLDEWEAILSGKKLMPHWNVDAERGINLKKVFHEPEDFDLILWVHGSGAAPFLEKGERTSPERWREMNGRFNGNLVGFAVWFN